jgi:archaellum biogenesis ATPase FlaH
MKLLLATGKQANNPDLTPYTPTPIELIKRLSVPVIGKKDGDYFTRSSGTKRTNNDTSDTASILILDGDSHINTETGEIISGAPAHDLVHIVLSDLGINHCICSSFSNGATYEELHAKDKPATDTQPAQIFNSGGLYGVDYHKYRVVIPCTYTREQLPILLNWIFEQLHKAGVMLINVKENRTWSQAWYFPRVPDQARLNLFEFYQFSKGENLNADATIQDWLKNNPQPEPTEPPPLKPKKPINETNGRRNPIKEFNQSFSVRDVLMGNGYTLKKGAYLRPNSDSGIAGVKLCLNCKDGIERVYSHGGDKLNDGFAHDAFDCYKILECGGNQDTALNFDAELTEHNRRIYAKEQAALNESKNSRADDNTTDKPIFSLSQFSLMGQSETMKKQMLEDVFVLEDLAILGQATVFYAQFNTGKTLLTLWLLAGSIKAHRIKGEDVFYINVDDTFKGLVTKNMIAEKYGFHMIGSNLNGFDPDKFTDYMKLMIDEQTARGKIIILDTLKKFTELMCKKKGTEFMKVAREFVQSGGTLIMLAHTNKNKGVDGKVVYGGTNDIPSDADCVFTLDTVSDDGITKQVLFENIKNRGNVAKEKAFSYRLDTENYHDLLESVAMEDDTAAKQAKQDKAINAKRGKDKHAIDAIINTIQQGVTLKTELIESAYDFSGISKAKLRAALEDYTGVLWLESPGARNAKSYTLK